MRPWLPARSEPGRVFDLVLHHAQRDPDRPALVWRDSRLNYVGLAAKVRQTADALLAAGVRHGDRVAMLATPRPEFVILFLAVSAIGAIWLGLHPRYRLGEFRHVIGEARPKLVFALPAIEDRDYRADLQALQAEHACIERVVALERAMAGASTLDAFLANGAGVPPGSFDAARARVQPDDPAAIIFTSGSTGSPKGALIAHFALVQGALTEQQHWPSAAPCVLSNMPINHIAGLGMTTLYGLLAGGRIVFQDRFEPKETLELIERERITFWLQAPTMFHLVVNHPDFGRHDIRSLEYIIWAGAPMAQDLVARLHRLGARLATSFGMTELGTYITYSDADADFEALANSIGRPEPRYELRLADAGGRIVPPGDEGEIQARGRWLMRGYFGHPEATTAAYTADGWFRTGDVAICRPDGNWRLVGRMKEMYKSGGYNIYPREVEIAIEEHGGVAMAAVIGVPDPLYHEVGHAFVQPMPGAQLEESELASWCRSRIANYKVPKRFTIVNELPRLPIGKIDKQSLKKNLA